MVSARRTETVSDDLSGSSDRGDGTKSSADTQNETNGMILGHRVSTK